MGSSVRAKCTKEAVFHAVQTVVYQALDRAFQLRGIGFLLRGVRARGGVLWRLSDGDGRLRAVRVADAPVYAVDEGALSSRSG